MPLQELTSEPVFMTTEEHARLQESTPASFEGHAPVLRLQLHNVQCTVQPQSAFHWGESSQSALQSNGIADTSAVQSGMLWVTEGELSFMPSSGKGFSLDYPSISLHAVSRTLPTAFSTFSNPSAGSSPGCLYCQLEGADQDEEGDSIIPELWFLPAGQDSVEPLFDALSYCASLHPSAGGPEDDDEGGHPFAGMPPFGTGVMDGQEQDSSDGAFDDAEEANDDVELSEPGRATLAHLDRLLEESERNSSVWNHKNSPVALFQSAGPRRAVDEQRRATNSLILVNLPEEVFTHPPLAASLLDLLHAYGSLTSWTPLPSFRRALIIYERVEGARRAKEALDRLLLPLIDDAADDNDDDDQTSAVHRTSPEEVMGLDLSIDDGHTETLRVYFGPMTPNDRTLQEGGEHLTVPSTDRNFLISPPGSPPVGWEPIKEDPPNRDTLADDLIRALGSLRDRGLGVQSHQPAVLPNIFPVTGKAEAPKMLPPPSLVIPPSQASVRTRHSHLAEEHTVQEEIISIPGLVVQSMDKEEGDDLLDKRLNKGLSISSVKATVDSLKGSFPSTTNTITPTSRPPTMT